jgi:peptide/nickel transport system substrate-binding protein
LLAGSSARWVLAAILMTVVACAPPSRSSAPTSQDLPTPQAPARTLVAVARAEPAHLAAKGFQQTGIAVITTTRIFNAGLAILDERDQPLPYLAEALPQLNTPAWQVFPDGRMETTYRLRPNLTWHDGQPLTADDFVFAASLYGNADYGVANAAPMNQIEDVLAPDPRTVVIRWRKSYPKANRLLATDFQPLPRHVLEESARTGTPDAFLGQAFWKGEYVGAGPYRLDRWEPGASIEAAAFAGHALGRPKIDRVRVLFIPDANTALANLLSGTVQVTFDEGIRLQQAIIVRREWAMRSGGTVLVLPGLWRYSHIQLNPERMGTRALADVRVRRALAHTLDKDAVNEGVYEGEMVPSDSIIPPNVDYFPDVDRAVTKYPYDSRRAEQLMAEAGYSKGADGTYVGPEGRVGFEVKVIVGSQNESEMAIMADTWRRAGFDVREAIYSTAEAQDGQARSSFSGLHTTNGNRGEDQLPLLGSAGTPRPENRWFGTNRGSWVNAEYDRLVDAFQATLDRPQRVQQVVRMVQLMTDDVPNLAINFTPYLMAYVAELRGPQSIGPDGVITWNVHMWDWAR